MIQLCVDFLTLKGKRDDLGLSLGDADEERLLALSHFFRDRSPAPESVPEFVQRDNRRLETRVAIQFHRPDGTLGDGTVRNLSGDGAFVETTTPLVAGSRTIVRAFDPMTGCEFRIVAIVAWSSRDGGMGLRLVGIPLELRVAHANGHDIKHAA